MLRERLDRMAMRLSDEELIREMRCTERYVCCTTRCRRDLACMKLRCLRSELERRRTSSAIAREYA